MAKKYRIPLSTAERTRCALAEHGLLGDPLVSLGLVTSISIPTVGRALKKRVKALAS